MEEVVDATQEAVVKRPRRRKTAKAAEPAVVPEEAPEVAPAPQRPRRPRARKAPAVVELTSSSTPSSPRRTKLFLVVGCVSLVVVGLSAWIGYSDAGAIDVSARIAERNAEVAAGAAEAGTQASTNQVVPVQTSAPAIPNGGFRPRGDGSAVSKAPSAPAEEVVASSTATSTDPMASTTDPVATNPEDGTEESSATATSGEGEADAQSSSDSADSGSAPL